MELQHSAPIFPVVRNNPPFDPMSAPARKGHPAAHIAVKPAKPRQLHCACCGRPFTRPSTRGPAPLYCSTDCQKQMRVRTRVWSGQADAFNGLRKAS